MFKAIGITDLIDQLGLSTSTELWLTGLLNIGSRNEHLKTQRLG
ncbi:hypothetical protein [Candidatus Hodgkinia cicadicola]